MLSHRARPHVPGRRVRRLVAVAPAVVVIALVAAPLHRLCKGLEPFWAFTQSVQEKPRLTVTGYSWAKHLSILRPPSREDQFLNSVKERWLVGYGQWKAFADVTHNITAMAWHEETLCLGLANGLIRTVDISSGSIVGEYYWPSEVPRSPITSLIFNDDVVIAGDQAGVIRVWPAMLPGSWGYAHSPACVSNSSGAVHGLVTLSNGDVVSISDSQLSDSEEGDIPGVVNLWNKPNLTSGVLQLKKGLRQDSPPTSVCAAADGTAAYIGREDGHILRISAEGEETSLGSVSDLNVPITAMTVTTQGLLVGLDDGNLHHLTLQDGIIQKDTPLSQLHNGQVESLAGTSMHGVPCVISTGSDGRVGVWNDDDWTLRWAIEGLASGRRNLAMGDKTRLVTTGLILKDDRPTNQTVRLNWKMKRTKFEEIPYIEALLAMDFLEGP